MCRNLLCLSSAVLLVGLVGAAVGLTGADGAGPDKAPPGGLDADPHLAAWWKFDDASGTTAADSSTHGRAGTLQGGLSFDKDSVPGRIGKALSLDGKGSVEVTGYKGVTGTAPRTVAAWVKTKAPKGEIAAWGLAEFGRMWTFGFVRGRIGVTPKGGYFYMNPSTSDDAWHHVAVVMAEAKAPNLHDHVRLYLDGEPAPIHDIGLLDLWPIETGSDLNVRIGGGFVGLVDDVRIYDRALSDDEVKALFAPSKSK
ncbi:MAG: LamG domain-containing protein [Planctomycetota bacterium]|nr:LamG domain-containing protein [Planctomycetota bacterium]